MLTYSAMICSSPQSSSRLRVLSSCDREETFHHTWLSAVVAVCHLGGYGVEPLLAGDDEADHAGPAALPHHEDVLHRGVGQQAALNLVSIS